MIDNKERDELIKWLKKFDNSFLLDVEKKSEWESCFDFFRQLAACVYTNKTAFPKDFLKIYHEAADNLTDQNGEEYDRTTRGIMSQSLSNVVKALLKDKIISEDFAKKVKQCEAAERIAVFAINN